ncbi:MAG: N-acetylglucosamine-6-phosphate deacetylase, partial [Dermatophilaceae bacterium]
MSAAIAMVHDVCGRSPVITHLFNGMPAFHHRAGGPAAAALAAAARGEAFVEVIADGVHLAPEVVRLVFDTVGADHVVLVSDAMAATGLRDGRYTLGSVDVLVAEGVARVRGRDGEPGAIAGSTRTLADCVRWAVEVAGVAETHALTAATHTPLRALGIR